MRFPAFDRSLLAATLAVLLPGCDKRSAPTPDVGTIPSVEAVPTMDAQARPANAADARAAEDASKTALCTKDSECVPASCCHATACTHVVTAPACGGIACTLDVQPGTLDTGKCVCRKGSCFADIAKPSADAGLIIQ